MYWIRPCCQVHQAAAHSSKLGVERIGHHPEFLHSLHADTVVHLQIGRSKFDRCAVHQDVGARLLSSVQFEAAQLGGGVRHFARITRSERYKLQRIAGRAAELKREIGNQFARHRANIR